MNHRLQGAEKGTKEQAGVSGPNLRPPAPSVRNRVLEIRSPSKVESLESGIEQLSLNHPMLKSGANRASRKDLDYLWFAFESFTAEELRTWYEAWYERAAENEGSKKRRYCW